MTAFRLASGISTCFPTGRLAPVVQHGIGHQPLILVLKRLGRLGSKTSTPADIFLS